MDGDVDDEFGAIFGQVFRLVDGQASGGAVEVGLVDDGSVLADADALVGDSGGVGDRPCDVEWAGGDGGWACDGDVWRCRRADGCWLAPFAPVGVQAFGADSDLPSAVLSGMEPVGGGRGDGCRRDGSVRVGEFDLSGGLA